MTFTIPEWELRYATKSWPAEDKAELEKRIGKQRYVDIMSVYKLFMPWQIERMLFEMGRGDVVEKWREEASSDKSFEDGTHTEYLNWQDKTLKMSLRDE